VIPKFIPPLTGLSVLVTRPQPQAGTLAEAIRLLGGEAIVFPAIAIEPVAVPMVDTADLVIFVSLNAVEHGISRLRRSEGTRVAAIGRATAAALTAAGWPADIIPANDFTSEALLAHPDLNLTPGLKAQIVQGIGGRDALHQELQRHQVEVDILEVYQRTRPAPDLAALTALERQWDDTGIDVVTATSVETLHNLHQLLSATGRRLLGATALLALSPRIAAAAAELGLRGECVLAQPDEQSMLGALARWRTRARNH
jgi:uroporphyrinogen-III synthase